VVTCVWRNGVVEPASGRASGKTCVALTLCASLAALLGCAGDTASDGAVRDGSHPSTAGTSTGAAGSDHGDDGSGSQFGNGSGPPPATSGPFVGNTPPPPIPQGERQLVTRDDCPGSVDADAAGGLTDPAVASGSGARLTTRTILFAIAKLKGAIYYNTYGSLLANQVGVVGGVVMRLRPGDPAPEVTATPSAAPGKRVVFALGTVPDFVTQDQPLGVNPHPSDLWWVDVDTGDEHASCIGGFCGFVVVQ